MVPVTWVHLRPQQGHRIISTLSSVRPWRPWAPVHACSPGTKASKLPDPLLSQIQELCPQLPPLSDPGARPLPHIHDRLLCGQQLPPAQPPSQ